VRIGPTVPDGRVELEIRGHTPCSVAGEVAAFGDALEVLGPPEVLTELARLAAELSALYAHEAPAPRITAPSIG
jgi:hypothetical protein